MAAADRDAPASTTLNVWDAASLVVGIVIGTTIFKAPGFIASQTSSPFQFFALWGLGGLFASLGALCYAELAATYGGAGGDYHYLTRAFGSWAGFLFSWTQLFVIQTVNIGALAAVFAEFALKTWFANSYEPSATEIVVLAGTAVAILTAVNIAGLTFGKRTQNLLTAAKLGGIALIILTALLAGRQDTTAAVGGPRTGDWTVALILILYAFGGWNDAAFMVTEVRDHERNIPRALIGGIIVITAVYLAVNLAYVGVLDFDGLQQSSRPPQDLMTAWWGPAGGRAITAVIMISALGAVSGLILSVSRVHAAAGADHRLFSLMGRWSNRHAAPVGSLIIQATFTLCLLGLIGTPAGRSLIDNLFQRLLGTALPWKQFDGPFDLLVSVGAPVFWVFFLATGLASIVLRLREPERPRPFRMPLFPLAPCLFCAMCLFGIFASVRWAGILTILGVVPVCVGGAVFLLERKLTTKQSGTSTS